MASTEYVVLQEVGLPDRTRGWILLGGTIEAGSPEAAIRRVVKELERDYQGAIFAAVPTRSWKPLEVTVKVERSMSIGEPGELSSPELDEREPDDEPEQQDGDPLDAALPLEPLEPVDDAISEAVAAGELPADAVKRNAPKGEGARY